MNPAVASTAPARPRVVDPAAARRGRLLAEVASATSSRAPTPDLDGGQRLQVLDTLIAVLGGAYAHLPAKRAAYAGDPVQALVLLRRRATDLTAAEFHLSVTTIVTGLRDAHTRYVGPSVLRGSVAALPFLVEQYGPDQARAYLVSKTNPDVIDDDGFAPGVRLESWNGIPFARAVELYGEHETGGRPDSRRARALETLTFRALDYGPPPDEAWVIVGFRTSRGRLGEVRLPWRILTPGKAVTAMTAGARGALRQGTDPAAEAVRRAKKLQFDPELWAADQRPHPRAGASAVPAAVGEWIATPMQDTLAARALSRSLGYLRVWSFDAADDEAFVDEVARLLGLLPQTGLIVDLRGNPGGLIWAAERMLQLFTDTPIHPTRFSLVASPMTRDMAGSPFNRLELEPWTTSLQDAVSTGEQYSQPLPLTDPAWCNDRGRCYPGPALAIVDANTYSSGDLFAAGWADHGIGPLVTVGQATGAGGANVWTSNQLRDALAGTDHPMSALPAGIGFTIAIRRAIRSAASDGVPIEDLGVAGTRYDMTRNDLLHGNRDLLAFCEGLLAGGQQAQPARTTTDPRSTPMVDFDPGPPKAVATHLAAMPSFAEHRDLFWYDWGPIFYRGRLDRSARLLCIASDPGPTERIACRTLVGDAGQRVQGFLSKLGLTRSYTLVNAFAYALLPSRAHRATPLLAEPAIQNWRNTLLDTITGPKLQAVVAFGGQAQAAVALWDTIPDVPLVQIPHPSSRDATALADAWRAAIVQLRGIVTPDPGGDATGPNYGPTLKEPDYARIPAADLPYGLPPWFGDDSPGRTGKPKHNNSVDRPSTDLLHTLIWQAQADQP